MPDMNVNWTGDPTGAVAAAGEVQAAIDAVHGKTVEINVVSNGAPGAAADVTSVGKASDGAATSAARHAAESARAARSVNDHATASSQAARAANEHAEAAGRAGSAVRSFGSDTDRATGSMRALGSSSPMLGIESGASRASGSMRELAVGTDGVYRAASRATDSIGDVGSRVFAMGRSMDALGSGSRPFAALEAGASNARQFMADASGQISGAAEAGAEGVSRFMADAAGETTRMSRDLVPAADRAGSSLERMGKSMSSALVPFEGGSKVIDAVGKILPDLTDGVDGASKVLPGLGKSLGSVSGIAGPAGTALKVAGMAAGVGALGMGILGAATAGIGVGAGLGAIMTSGPLLNQAQKGLEGFTGEFKKASHEAGAASAGMPGMKALVGESKELGQTLGGIGVRQLPLALAEANTLGSQLNGTLKQLEPAMGPAIQAGGALGSALLTAVGNSAPYIAEFSKVAESAAPALGKEMESTARAATALGGGGLQLLAAAEPLIRTAANVAEAGTDTALGAVGIKSSYSGPKNADGTSAAGGFNWNKVGDVLTSSILPGIATMNPVSVGAGIAGLKNNDPWISSGTPGSDGQSGTSKHVPTQGGEFFSRQYPTAANPDMGEKAGPGQATFQPGQGFGKHWNESAPVIPGTAPMSSLKPTDRAAELSHGSPTQGVSPSRRTPDQNGLEVPGTRTPGEVVQSHVGSSMGGGDLSNLRQELGGVNSAMQQTGQTAGMFGSQFSSSMSQTQSAAMGSTSAVHQSMLGATQGVQQAQPAMQQAAQNAFSPLTQQAQQAQPAQAMQAPMQAAAASVQSQAPAMASAGSDAGAAVGEGMGQGITKEITNTLTIVKKWAVSIIDTAASTLGIASPSTVFYGFGQNVPQGFIGGVQNAAPASVSAVQSMMQDSIGAAQGTLSGASGQITGGLGSSLQSSVQDAFSPLTGQMQSGLQGAFNPLTGQMEAGMSGLTGGMQSVGGQFGQQPGQVGGQWPGGQQTSAGQLNPTTEGKGYYNTTSGGKPLTNARNDRIAEARKNSGTDADGKSLYDKRADNLIGAKGMTGNSAANLLDRQDKHNKLRGEILGRASINKDAAWASIHPELNTKGMGQEGKAFAWRDSAEYNGGKAWDPATSQAGANTPAKQNVMSDLQKAQQKELNPQQPGTSLNAAFPLGMPQEASALGQVRGENLNLGTTTGIQDTASDVASAAKQSIANAEKETNKQAGINSPSTVWAGIGNNIGLGTVEGINTGVSGAGGGVASGLGGAISDASSSIKGVASDRGLMVGYSWATSMVDGVASVMKKADFQNAGFPQIESDLAKTALGQLGLLGPAGSGASIWKTPMVTMGGDSGSSSQTSPPIHLTINLDGEPFRRLVVNSQDALVSAVADSLGMQVG